MRCMATSGAPSTSIVGEPALGAEPEPPPLSLLDWRYSATKKRTPPERDLLGARSASARGPGDHIEIDRDSKRGSTRCTERRRHPGTPTDSFSNFPIQDLFRDLTRRQTALPVFYGTPPSSRRRPSKQPCFLVSVVRFPTIRERMGRKNHCISI
ncbi:hypothetical protein LZ31DRAFT_66501 [Colletotrichum somersetense]|nr:hypothetical protein LZ31DRAFT_66501 [Colletotrichum somersetense]